MMAHESIDSSSIQHTETLYPDIKQSLEVYGRALEHENDTQQNHDTECQIPREQCKDLQIFRLLKVGKREWNDDASKQEDKHPIRCHLSHTQATSTAVAFLC